MITLGESMLFPEDVTAEFLTMFVFAVSAASGLSLAIAAPIRQRPALRHAILLAGLICTASAPMLLLLWHLSNSSLLQLNLRLSVSKAATVHRATQSNSSTGENAMTIETERDAISSVKGMDDVQQDQLIRQHVADRPSGARVTPVRSRLPGFRIVVSVVFGIWATGSVWLLIRFSIASLQVTGISQRARPLQSNKYRSTLERVMRAMNRQQLPPICISPEVATPVVTGLTKPRILLPASAMRVLSDDELQEILIHETAHAIRRDLWVIHLEALTVAICWPIPLVTILVNKLSFVREELCDLYVISTREPVAYGQTLLRVAQLAISIRQPALMLGVVRGPGRLERRVTNLLNLNRDESAIASWQTSLAILVAFLTVTGLICGTRLTAGPGLRVDDLQPPHGQAAAARGDAKAIEKIELLGGSIERDIDAAGNLIVSVSLAGCGRLSDQHLHLLGEIQDLRTLDLGETKITDEGLKVIGNFKGLITLKLNWTQISDDGLQYLSGLENLVELNLWDNPRITDNGSKHLVKLSNLRNLNLHNTSVANEGLKELRGLRNLESLNLFGTKITSTGLQDISLFQNLKSLNLSGIDVEADDLKQLSQLRNLRSLNLFLCHIEDEGLKELCQFGGKLSELNIGGNRITDSGLQELGKLSQLTDLYLGFNRFTDQGLHQLANLKQLKSLSLFTTNLTDAGLKILREHGVLLNVSHLELGSTQISNKGLQELQGMSDLNSLQLFAATGVGNKGLKFLRDQGLLDQVSTLDLSHTQVTDEGLKHLRGLPHLSVLGLSGIAVSDAGLQELVDLPNLKSLYFLKHDGQKNARITDKGMKDLSKFEDLTHLGLEGTEITDAGLAELCKCRNLTSLNLSRTNVTPSGMTMLKRLKHLRKIHVAKMGLTDDDRQTVKEALPNVRVFN